MGVTQVGTVVPACGGGVWALCVWKVEEVWDTWGWARWSGELSGDSGGKWVDGAGEILGCLGSDLLGEFLGCFGAVWICGWQWES